MKNNLFIITDAHIPEEVIRRKQMILDRKEFCRLIQLRGWKIFNIEMDVCYTFVNSENIRFFLEDLKTRLSPEGFQRVTCDTTLEIINTFSSSTFRVSFGV